MAKRLSKPTVIEGLAFKKEEDAPISLSSDKQVRAMQLAAPCALPAMLTDKLGQVWRKSMSPPHSSKYHLLTSDGKVRSEVKEYAELVSGSNGKASYNPESDSVAVQEIHKRLWGMADQSAKWLLSPLVQVQLRRAVANTDCLCFLVEQSASLLELAVDYHLPRARELANFLVWLRTWFAFCPSSHGTVQLVDSVCVLVNRDGSNLRAILNLTNEHIFYHELWSYRVLEQTPKELVDNLLVHTPDGEVDPLLLFRARVRAAKAARAEFSWVSNHVIVEKATHGLKVMLPFTADFELFTKLPLLVHEYEALSGRTVTVHNEVGVRLQDKEAAGLIDTAIGIRKEVIESFPGVSVNAVAKVRYEGPVLVEAGKTKGRYRPVLDLRLTSSGYINDPKLSKLVTPYEDQSYDLMVSIVDQQGGRALKANMVATRRRLKL